MFHEKILFTEEECKKILNYRFDYPLHYVTPPQTLVKGTRTVYYSVDIKNEEWMKKYNVWDIVKDKNTKWIYYRLYDWLESIVGFKIERTFSTTDTDKHRHSHKLHEYNLGDRFDKHVDDMDVDSDRIWNIGIVLNTDFEGGNYICYDESDTPYMFKKVTGNVVAYTSDVPHEITEITKGKRYSMVVSLNKWELESKKNKSLI